MPSDALLMRRRHLLFLLGDAILERPRVLDPGDIRGKRLDLQPLVCYLERLRADLARDPKRLEVSHAHQVVIVAFFVIVSG